MFLSNACAHAMTHRCSWEMEFFVAVVAAAADTAFAAACDPAVWEQRDAVDAGSQCAVWYHRTVSKYSLALPGDDAA